MGKNRARYFWDQEAVREEAITPVHARGGISHEGLLTGPMERLKADGSSASQYADHDRVWGISASRNARSVWTITPKPFRGAHFATFPPELVTRCVKAGSRLGDTVLDPFIGSGTTAAVAKSLGRNAIGIDLNSKYLAMARARVKAEQHKQVFV